MDINKFIKRWLNLVDLRDGSSTYGICDREYWAWKTKDFANATQQVGLYSFLLYNKESEEYSTEFQSRLINSILMGTKKIQRSNGSFEEAYPMESSYCVTGLVQFYFLLIKKQFESLLSRSDIELLDKIVQNSNSFLDENVEKHGIISNHLMTSYLAGQLFEEDSLGTTKINTKLSELLNSQNKEGWYIEYDGADPGYQSLLNHYLVLYFEVSSDEIKEKIRSYLIKSSDFISNFFFSDGSFSGAFSSRGTELLYPSGYFSIIKDSQNLDAWLTNEMKDFPLYVDIGNFVPVLSAWTSFFYIKNNFDSKETTKEVHFIEAKLLVLSNEFDKLIISLKNGSFKHVVKGKDYSITSFCNKKEFTQLGTVNDCEVKETSLSLKLGSSKINQQLNNLPSSILLRFLSITIYSFPFLQNILKVILKKFVMGKNKSNMTHIEIDIDWKNKIDVNITNPDNWTSLKCGYYSHMASANYTIVTSKREFNET